MTPMLRKRRPANSTAPFDAEFCRFAVGYSPTLVKAAYLLLGDLDVAEDAVQVTMLRIFRRWANAREAPEAYSRQALVNVCRDHWRRQHRRVDEVSVGEARAVDLTTSFSDAVDDREALDQALRGLPQLQREVLVLRYFLDFSIARTAEVLDVPRGTVKSCTHRGLHRLRELLQPAEEVSPCTTTA